MTSPRGYHYRHAPRHAVVVIFEVLWSDGPPDLLCNFDEASRASQPRPASRETGPGPAPGQPAQPSPASRETAGSHDVDAILLSTSPGGQGRHPPSAQDLPPGVLIFFPHPKCIYIFKTLSFLNE